MSAIERPRGPTVPTRYWHRLDGRPGPVRRLPALLHAAGRAAGALLRARAGGRRGRPDDLRPLERLLRRPDREEAAQPLPAGIRGPLLRHRGLQPVLQVLPELGHQQVARDREARRRGLARVDRARGEVSSDAGAWPSRTTIRRSSSSTRSTSRRRAARSASARWPSPPATSASSRARISTSTSTRPTWT